MSYSTTLQTIAHGWSSTLKLVGL
jgi:glycogen debranching enzyme